MFMDFQYLLALLFINLYRGKDTSYKCIFFILNYFPSMYRCQHIKLHINRSCSIALKAMFEQKCMLDVVLTVHRFSIRHKNWQLAPFEKLCCHVYCNVFGWVLREAEQSPWRENTEDFLLVICRTIFNLLLYRVFKSTSSRDRSVIEVMAYKKAHGAMVIFPTVFFN